MRWDSLGYKSKNLIRSVCKDLKRKQYGIDFQVSRVAAALERTWTIDKLVVIFVSLLAVAVALYSTLQANAFLTKEAADRDGDILRRVFIGEVNSNSTGVLDDPEFLAKLISSGTMQYDCTVDSQFGQRTVFIVWVSKNGASLSEARIEDDLNKNTYRVNVFEPEGDSRTIYTTPKAEDVKIERHGIYPYIKVINSSVHEKIKTIATDNQKGVLCLDIELVGERQ